MKRHGYTRDAMRAVREAYKIIFRDGKTVPESLEALDALVSGLEDEKAKECVGLMREFLATSQRGVTREK
jgi:UDP-N-acetylglucosamine acyltransferase